MTVAHLHSSVGKEHKSFIARWRADVDEFYTYILPYFISYYLYSIRTKAKHRGIAIYQHV